MDTDTTGSMVELVAPGVARIRFVSGTRANTLTAQTRRLLLDAIGQVQGDREVRAVLLCGGPEHFCAGQDLREHAELLRNEGAEAIGAMVAEEFGPLAAALYELPQPVVVQLHGATAGAGLGLALAGDLRIASAGATFTTAFAGIGLVPDTGVSYLLAATVGRARAADLLLRPRVIDAAHAYDIGLVTEISEDVEGRALAVAIGLAAGPAQALTLTKELLRNPSDLPGALLAEAQAQATAAATLDHAEGVEAFLAKRSPVFRGR